MAERRKHPRYKAHIMIKYRRLDNPLSTWQQEPLVKNISLGGMLFSAYEKMPLKTPVVFKLQLFTGESVVKVLELRANVVDVEEGVISYDTRVAFIDLDGSARKDLKEFMNYIA